MRHRISLDGENRFRAGIFDETSHLWVTRSLLTLNTLTGVATDRQTPARGSAPAAFSTLATAER